MKPLCHFCVFENLTRLVKNSDMLGFYAFSCAGNCSCNSLINTNPINFYGFMPSRVSNLSERLNKPSATKQKPQHKTESNLTPNPVGSGPKHTCKTCSQHPVVTEIESGHLAEGLAGLFLFCHALGHPLLVATQLIVSLDLQELHLLFASVSFPLQPHELKGKKGSLSHTDTASLHFIFY